MMTGREPGGNYGHNRPRGYNQTEEMRILLQPTQQMVKKTVSQFFGVP